MAIVREKSARSDKLFNDGELYTQEELGLAYVAECREKIERQIRKMQSRDGISRRDHHDLTDLYLQVMVLAELVEHRVVTVDFEIAA